MKRRDFLVLAVVLSLILSLGLANPVFSASIKTATVTTSVLNVRSGPGTTYSRITTVKANTILPVLSERTGWVQISLPTGRSGWVSSSFVAVKTVTPKEWAQVNVNVLNVRSGPGTSHGILGTLSKGTSVPVQQKINSWLLVQLPDGKSGWVMGTYTTLSTKAPAKPAPAPTPAPTPPPVPEPLPAPVTPAPAPADPITSPAVRQVMVHVTALNVRTGPSTDHPVIALLPQGTIVDVADESNEWLLVTIPDGQTGWIASWHVTAVIAPVVPDPSGNEETKPLPLNGKIIVLDPGHGGSNPGAIGVTGLYEKVIILDVSLQLAELLRAQGATVIMTRDSDVEVSLAGRVMIAEAAKADIFVSIHANAHLNRSIGGTETYYYQGKPSSAKAFLLASQIQNQLVLAHGLRNIGVKHGNFHVIRETTMPSVLAELAFLSNAAEEALMKTPEFRQKSAQAILNGIMLYFQQTGGSI